MNLLVVFIGLTIFALGSAEYLISTINDKGEYVTEDLDHPVAITYGTDINKLRYFLYTQNNKDTPYELKYNDANNLIQSPLNPNVPTKFIIHGWQGSYEGEPQSLKEDFLNAQNVNVILLDWKAYNSPYISSVANTQSIGKNYATFVEYLIAKGGLQPNNIHVIGHSLGAHIAGYLGKNVGVKLARITGLDPAGPMFGNSKPTGRLDASDAIFVDAIHSSTMAGINKPITQADFFPNGGSNQPACLTAPVVGGCDHTAPYQYYGASITQRDKYPAKKCSSANDAKVADSKNSPCVNSGAVMGDDAVNRLAQVFTNSENTQW